MTPGYAGCVLGTIGALDRARVVVGYYKFVVAYMFDCDSFTCCLGLQSKRVGLVF
jgi:hypothetical protein